MRPALPRPPRAASDSDSGSVAAVAVAVVAAAAAVVASVSAASAAAVVVVVVVVVVAAAAAAAQTVVLLPALTEDLEDHAQPATHCSSSPQSQSHPNRLPSHPRALQHPHPHLHPHPKQNGHGNGTVQSVRHRTATGSAWQKTRCSRGCCRGPRPKIRSRYARSAPPPRHCADRGGGDGGGDGAGGVG
jgi:ABC-type nickel/cobalt efflux system permease component RcnA